jgi:hypothetical protein
VEAFHLSPAAFLLGERGYDVIGATMKSLEGKGQENSPGVLLLSCEGAQQVAEQLEFHFRFSIWKKSLRKRSSSILQEYEKEERPTLASSVTEKSSSEFFWRKLENLEQIIWPRATMPVLSWMSERGAAF